MLFARKVNKISEFHMIFARKMPEFYVMIALKIFFSNLGVGARAPVPPVSYAHACEHFFACSRHAADAPSLSRHRSHETRDVNNQPSTKQTDTTDRNTS